MDEVERSLLGVAKEISERRPAPEIEVLVDTRWLGPFRAQGLCAYNLWTDAFEPVRKRWPFSRRWMIVQAPEDAARRIQWFLTNRPDLPPEERPSGWTRE